MYLGIDPGYRKLGYSILDKDWKLVDAGLLTEFDSQVDVFERMVNFNNFFDSKILEYEIKVVWIEKYFVTAKNLNNVEKYYYIRWSIIYNFVRQWIKIVEWTPLQVKKWITWNWNAWKEAVKSFVCKIFWLETIKYHDISDAIAISYITYKKTS